MAESSLQQVMEQRLQQTLSPLQVQYVRALEMNSLEYDEEVRRQIDDNPALEEDDSADLLPKGDHGEDSAEFNETAEQMQLADYRDEDDVPYYRLNAQNASPSDRSAAYDPTLSHSVGPSLSDALIEQLDLLELSPELKAVATYVVGDIDRNGYLTRTVDEMIDDIAFASGHSVTRLLMQKALATVQQLEPAGVGAADLRECLLLQLQRIDDGQSQALADARLIVADYFDLFAARHFDRLQTAASLSEQRLRDAMDIIKGLNPKPGAAFESTPGEEQMRRIVPDFEVDVEGNRLTVTLLGSPNQLKVADSFDIDDNTIARLATKKNDESLAFIRRKRDEAVDFIKASAMRRATLMRVMSAIAGIQKQFFMTGDKLDLKPMILKDVAAVTGDDLSVISRATAGKYVQTPSGIYPLKFFFNEKPRDDIDASAQEILDSLKKIIEQEDRRDPLSDQALSERLAEQGYAIARRTVTKYRERLGFPVARLRREL